DPRVAIDFFTWGITRCPAKRYLTVIWNHGSGIDETDVYRSARRKGGVAHRRLRTALNNRFRRSLFSGTLAAALRTPDGNARAIAYDDSSRDFLDNMELARVLAAVKKKLGRKIDLMGFDACLMNMVEVAYELRGSADFIVGSEEIEPGDGWP